MGMELCRNSEAVSRILLKFDLPPQIWNNNQSMKTIFGSAVVILLVTVFFIDARLSAEDTQSADMRLYPADNH